MNIFAVDHCPRAAARALHDAHVVKMPLETAQIFSTLARGYGAQDVYRSTHARHPCTLWAGASHGNAAWLHRHGVALFKEYAGRFGREHASRPTFERAAAVVLASAPVGGLTPWAQAMPEQYRGPCAVDAYRRYYRAEKLTSRKGSATWRTAPPSWL